MQTVNSENFQAEVLQSKLPVMVKFTAEFCKPCAVLQPVLEKIADELEGKAILVKLDIDESPDLAATYKIKSIPTMLVFKDGQLLNRASGSQTPKEEIIAMFELQESK